LRGFQARLAIAQDQETTEDDLVALVQKRFDQGLAPERDLNRAVAERESVRAGTAPLRAEIQAQMNRLDVLMGDQPGANRALLFAAQAIPAAPLPSGSTTPADLLRRRPDVVAAEQNLVAANARIGIAIADYYPHISLDGLLGTASVATSSLFTNGAVQVTGDAAMQWRLFDFGRVDAEIARAKGRNAETLAAWRQTVLRAIEDVETALTRVSEAHMERESLERQLSRLTRAHEQTQRAYAGGVASLIDALDANRQELAASDRLETVKVNEARAAVAAYRALGGGWQPPALQNVAVQSATAAN
jgi:outer membrane protein TolC